MMTAAYSSATWGRLASSVHSMQKFALHTGTQVSWPFSQSIVHKYIAWAFDKAELSVSTIKAYIHDFSTIHRLKGLDNSVCTSFFTLTALKGAENMELYKNISKKCKSTMDLDLLKKLGSQIAKSSMSTHDKQVYWVACTLAFWGSLRMGELLQKTENELSFEAMTWSDIKESGDSITLHIKIPKVKSRNGDDIHIFEFKGHNVCPVKAFKALKHMSSHQSQHIFTLDSGKNLTIAKFTQNIKIWSAPYKSKDFVDSLSGHSFRNAIPSVLACRPDLAEEDDICTWGRWTSLAFRIYARTTIETKRAIFRRICQAITDAPSRLSD
jgi:hypothetical protein